GTRRAGLSKVTRAPVGESARLVSHPRLEQLAAHGHRVGVGPSGPALMPDLDGLANEPRSARRHRTADGDALVHQRRNRDVPALSHAAKSHRIGHAHFAEETLVELGLA